MNLKTIGFQKYWPASFLVLLLVGFFFIIRKQPSPKKEVSPPETPIINRYRSVISPGETTAQEVKPALGNPAKTSEEEGSVVYEYPSRFPRYPSKIFIDKNEKVFLIKEPVKYEEKRNVKKYLEKYGEPEARLFSKNLGSAYISYVYPKEGLAVFVHSIEGSIIEIWFFPPTSIESFREEEGKELVLDPPDSPESLKK